ncbi:MAG: N-methyl-L-tryptophan oxidase [Chloroflexia bacterium]|nr:N-methyl-L-tryptophan oxidase [Chloroflexia bacterium]
MTAGDKGYDVIVIGGGTMGTAAAWELGKRGVRSLVLEQFNHIHPFGAHGGRTRVIRHAYAEGPEYVPLVQRADRLWLQLEEESGERILMRTGGLELAAPGFGHARSARASADRHGLPYEWLTPDEGRRRWPMVSIPDDWDVMFSPQAGYLYTDAALRTMAASARNRGVDIHEQEPVLGWESSDTGVAVTTTRGTYRADRLIITAGAWSSEVLADLGLPLHILRKSLWWFDVEDPALFAPDRFPVFVADSDIGEIYGFPIDDYPGLKVADHSGGDRTTPHSVERTVRVDEAANVASMVKRLFPTATDRIREQAVCLYTMTPDGDFIMDRHPTVPGVVFGAGFSGHGFKFTTAVGEHLVALALDPAHEPIPRLALNRFQPVARS